MRRSPDFLLGFLLATAIGVVILLFVADPQTYHQICETNQYSGKESCAPHNVPYVVAWYIGHWFDASAAVITAIATGFIARFTFTLKRSTDSLWDAGERQMQVIRDNAAQQSSDMQASTGAALHGAEIARRAAANMQRNAEQQLRAYVFVENAFYKRAANASGAYRITFRIKNFGLTPAHRVRVLKGVRVVDWNGGNPEIPTPIDEDSLGSMAPNQDFVNLDAGELAFDTRQLFNERAVYLVGTIIYRTVFDGNGRSNFRYFIGGDDADPLDYNEGEMNVDDQGNDAT